MGRLGQDKPAFGWELEPFWPLLLYRVATLRMITRRSELHHAQVRRVMAAWDLSISLGPYSRLMPRAPWWS